MLIHNAYNEAEVLKWISERNRHIPIEELAFMVNIPREFCDGDIRETSPLEDYDFVN